MVFVVAVCGDFEDKNVNRCPDDSEDVTDSTCVLSWS